MSTTTYDPTTAGLSARDAATVLVVTSRITVEDCVRAWAQGQSARTIICPNMYEAIHTLARRDHVPPAWCIIDTADMGRYEIRAVLWMTDHLPGSSIVTIIPQGRTHLQVAIQSLSDVLSVDDPEQLYNIWPPRTNDAPHIPPQPEPDTYADFMDDMGTHAPEIRMQSPPASSPGEAAATADMIPDDSSEHSGQVDTPSWMNTREDDHWPEQAPAVSAPATQQQVHPDEHPADMEDTEHDTAASDAFERDADYSHAISAMDTEKSDNTEPPPRPVRIPPAPAARIHTPPQDEVDDTTGNAGNADETPDGSPAQRGRDLLEQFIHRQTPAGNEANRTPPEADMAPDEQPDSRPQESYDPNDLFGGLTELTREELAALLGSEDDNENAAEDQR